MNTFTWPLEFNKPIAVNEEILGHGILVLQGVHICDGSSKARIMVTVNGEKFVVANLDPSRRVSSKLNLMISGDNGEVQFSCNQGAKVVLTGSVEMDSCCDGDDHHHHDDEEMESSSEIEAEGDEEVAAEESDVEDDESAIIEEGSSDEDDLDLDLSDDDESESSEEEEIIPQVENPAKKVTFNPKEQGPHKSKPAQETPLKPAIKQQAPPAEVVSKPQAPVSKVGSTMSLPGGLKYTILREGRGPVASYGKRVRVKYDGSLVSNGKRFDKGNIGFKLGAGEVIEGWDKGVKDMRVGEARRLLIPANLGYGKRGAPPAIPGNAALVFEVELINLK